MEVTDLLIVRKEITNGFVYFYSPFVKIKGEDFEGVGRFKSDGIPAEDDEDEDDLLGMKMNDFFNSRANYGIGFDGVIDNELLYRPDDIESIDLIEDELYQKIENDNQPQRAVLNYLYDQADKVNIPRKDFFEMIHAASGNVLAWEQEEPV